MRKQIIPVTPITNNANHTKNKPVLKRKHSDWFNNDWNRFLFSTAENEQYAAQKFSAPNIKNKGKKQLRDSANFVNLLIFHQSIQFLGNQIQVDPTTKDTYDRLERSVIYDDFIVCCVRYKGQFRLAFYLFADVFGRIFFDFLKALLHDDFCHSIFLASGFSQKLHKRHHHQ